MSEEKFENIPTCPTVYLHRADNKTDPNSHQLFTILIKPLDFWSSTECALRLNKYFETLEIEI